LPSKKPSGRKLKIIDIPECWLICCDGKSEALYLKSLIDDLFLRSNKNKHRIHIGDGSCLGYCSSQHKALLDKAIKCGSCYDRIWIVTDQDAKGVDTKKLGQEFQDTVREADNNNIGCAWTIPKFEYWMLIHGNPMAGAPDDSVIDKKLKEYMVGCKNSYDEPCERTCEKKCDSPASKICEKALDKPYPNSYKLLGGWDAMNTAKKYAEKLYEENRDDINNYNFSSISCGTSFHLLIDELLKYFELDT